MSLTDSSPLETAQRAARAARDLATLPTEARNQGLTAIHAALEKAKDAIFEANAQDVELAISAAKEGILSESLVKRLDLRRPGKWEEMLSGILDVRDLDDPGT